MNPGLYLPAGPQRSCIRRSIQEVVGHPGLLQREEVLLLCGPGISPLLTQPSSTSSAQEGIDPGTILQPKPITLDSNLELFVHTGHLKPWFQTITRGPKEGGRQETQMQWGAGGRRGTHGCRHPFL